MSKKTTKNLKKLETVSRTIGGFQKFCYAKVKKYGISDFLKLYVRVLFEPQTHLEENLQGEIKSNLAELSDNIIAKFC